MNKPVLSAAPVPEPLRVLSAVFCAFLLLGVVFTWPLVLQFDQAVIQKGELPIDAAQGVWNLWWARVALLGGMNPWFTSYLFYPLEINLFYQTLSLPNALLVWPVLVVFGPVVAFNSVTLLSFGLGGLWVSMIARHLGLGRWGALLAGFIFVATPYHMQRIWSGPLELIAIHWLALYGLLLLRALAVRTIGWVLAAGVALLIVTLASQYYGLYAAVYTALHGSLAALVAPRGQRWASFATAGGIGLVWFGLLLPLAWSSLGGSGLGLADWYERQVFHSVALVDLVMPNLHHPLWGPPALRWHTQLHPFGVEAGAGIGLGVALLILLALWRVWPRAWPWALLGLAMLLLAMGPQLRLTAADSPIPGPFMLLNLSGIFRNSSRPSIFVALWLIPCAVLVGLGLTSVLQSGWPVRRWLAGVLTGLILIESSVAPWPLMPLTVAPHQALNQDAVAGAVLELPPQLNDSRGLLNQICHGRPLMGGYLARLPAYPLMSSPSVTQALWFATPPRTDIMPLSASAELASLGVRFVTLDRQQLPRIAQEYLRQWLSDPGISQFSTNELREVYQIDPAAARPAVMLGSGWYELEQDATRRWRWMGERADLTFVTRQTTAIQLRLTATAYTSDRPLEFWQHNQMIHRVIIPTAPFEQTVTLRLLVPAGQTSLQLRSTTNAAADTRQLSLAVMSIEIHPLATDSSWQAAQTLAIPPTLSTLAAAPCQAPYDQP